MAAEARGEQPPIGVVHIFSVCRPARPVRKQELGSTYGAFFPPPAPLASRAQFFLPERVRPGLLRVPTAGVGGVLPDLESVRLDECARARGLCTGGLRLGNAG